MQTNYVGKITKKSAQNLIIKLRSQLIKYAKNSSCFNKTTFQLVYISNRILSGRTIQVQRGNKKLKFIKS